MPVTRRDFLKTAAAVSAATAIGIPVSDEMLAIAKEAQSVIEDPVMEARVMGLSAELRCLVCQGQSLAESHADFAVDMRRKMQELMESGMTDQQVVDYLVERYGDFIRFRPPMKGTTALLWFGPLLLFVVGTSVLVVSLKRRQQRGAAPLSDEERQHLDALLSEEAEDSKA